MNKKHKSEWADTAFLNYPELKIKVNVWQLMFRKCILLREFKWFCLQPVWEHWGYWQFSVHLFKQSRESRGKQLCV